MAQAPFAHRRRAIITWLWLYASEVSLKSFIVQLHVFWRTESLRQPYHWFWDARYHSPYKFWLCGQVNALRGHYGVKEPVESHFSEKSEIIFPGFAPPLVRDRESYPRTTKWLYRLRFIDLNPITITDLLVLVSYHEVLLRLQDNLKPKLFFIKFDVFIFIVIRSLNVFCYKTSRFGPWSCLNMGSILGHAPSVV